MAHVFVFSRGHESPVQPQEEHRDEADNHPHEHYRVTDWVRGQDNSPVSEPDVEENQQDRNDNPQGRACAHTRKQGRRHSSQNFSDYGSILRNLAPDPPFSVLPGKVVALSVVVAKLDVISIDNLLNLRQSDSVSLRAESHVPLKKKKMLG